MRLKAVSGIMLTLLLTGMLTLAFNVPPIVADNGITGLLNECSTFQNSFLYDGSENHSLDQNALAEENSRLYSADDDKWNFNEINEWADFANIDGDSAELVIGVNNGKPNSYADVIDLVSEIGGNLVGTVSMGGDIGAVVADIPLVAVSSFVTEVRAAGLSRYIEPNIKVQACFVPNDPNWPMQWGPAKIETDYAWNTTIGDPSVLVAVIDTGIDYHHPDLAANYVALGYDWVNNDSDPIDDHGHGTHCAGIMAAVINNNIGIAGLAQVSIMAEKALNDYGSGYAGDLANAIIHAVDCGARILGNSWGGYFESELIHEAILYAYYAGALVVAAAGNEKTASKLYPAAYKEVVAVTATNQSDNPAWFTNFGEWVEVAAPGVDIYSTISKTHYFKFSYPYDSLSGTSMATPHVAGVAALIWSLFPNMTRDQVWTQLRYAADDLGDQGFDWNYGWGRINARRAVEQAPTEHDLLIWFWDILPALEPWDLLTVNTTVFNFGKVDESNITVRLLVNGNIVDSTHINFLESNTMTTVSCSWIPMVEGIYNITSYVVPVPGETITIYNARSRNVRVKVGKFFEVPTDYSTIQDAINSASPGYTILVGSGIYYEHVVIQKSLKLVGEDRSTTIIDGSGIGAVVEVAAEDVCVGGFTIRNGGKEGMFDCGILMRQYAGIAIINNTVTDQYEGIMLWGSYGTNKIIGNTVGSHNDTGIALVFSDGNYIIDGNTVENSSLGIVAIMGGSNTISNNTVTSTDYGIWLVTSSDNTVRGNKVINNYRGIILASSNGTIRDNRVENNERGIELDGASSNRIYHNDFIHNTAQVHFEDSPSPNTWDDGYPSGGNYWSDYDGVDANHDGIGDTPYIINENNIDNYPFMLPLATPFYGPMAKFTYSPKPASLYGAVTFNASASASGWNGTARVPVVSYTWDFDDGNIITVTNPVIFYVFSAESVYRVNLTVTCDDSVLIEKGCASDSTWQDVRVTGTIYIRADGSVYPPTAPISSVDNVTYTFTGNVYHSIVVERNNIVVDGAGYTVQGRGSGKGIDLTGRSNVTIKNMKIKAFEYGIYLWHSLNNNISGNTITDNTYGIYLYSSSNYNIVSGNNIINDKLTPEYWDGICLYSSSNYNTVSRNTITNNIHGIRVSASSNYNTVSGNTITNNYDGISLYSSSNYNTVSRNTITNNEFGIAPHYSSDNEFYHNNFVNNSNQAVSYSSVNVWDDGYPSGGNYWSDYTGVDLCSGPYQNETGSDGIGDTSYVIDANNRDRYPLMDSFSEFIVTWEGVTYHVDIVSNSTLSDFCFSPPDKLISFNVTGTDGTVGFCRIATPKQLLRVDHPEQWIVLVDDEAVHYTVMENGKCTYIYFTYIHSTHKVQIVGIYVGPQEYTLTIYSSPSGVTFTVDGVPRATPWSGIYSEGSSVSLVMPEIHIIGDAGYYWNQWSDGKTSRTRTVTVNTNVTLAAYYTGPYYKYQLTVTSSPITGITFTIDGVPQTTPYTEWLFERSYTLEMPETHTVGGARYYWNQWNDGVISRSRVVTMNTNITLTARYTGPYHQLTVTSSPITGIQFTINGAPKTTPYTEWLPEGSYTLIMPQTHNGYVWSHWLEDGDTSRIKTITLPSTTWTAVYEPAPKPVGGKATPINIPTNKPETPALWIWLTTIILSLVATVVYAKKRKRNTEIIS